MRWSSLAVLCWFGCGRISFAPVGDAQAPDAEATGPFSDPVELPGVNSGANEDDPSMTADLLELYFMSNRSGTSLLYRATRADPDDAWSAPVPVDELNSLDINNPKVLSDGRSPGPDQRDSPAARQLTAPPRRTSRTTLRVDRSCCTARRLTGHRQGNRRLLRGTIGTGWRRTTRVRRQRELATRHSKRPVRPPRRAPSPIGPRSAGAIPRCS